MKMSEGVCKYLDCSTAHVTRQDDELLGEDVGRSLSPVIAYRTDCGYWVFVSGDAKDTDYVAMLREQGYSKAFSALLMLCFLRDVQWIKLDAGGNVYEDLEKFDW